HRRLSQVHPLAAPFLQARFVRKEAMADADVPLAGEDLAGHVPEGILLVGQRLLPVGLEDDEPAPARLRVDAPAAPLSPLVAAFRPPGALKRAVIAIDSEPALAAGLRLLVAEDKALAVPAALHGG